MIERDIDIEFEAEQIAIEAKICFTFEYGQFQHRPLRTKIKRVVDLELNEGARPIPTTTKHFKMLEKHWEDHDVYDEI